MIHFLLLLVCILSVEVFIRFNFLSLLDSILKVTKKVTYVIPQNNISDNWKEKVIPAYALKIMKYSLQILLILLLIMSLFFIADYFFNDFLFPVFLFGQLASTSLSFFTNQFFGSFLFISFFVVVIAHCIKWRWAELNRRPVLPL